MTAILFSSIKAVYDVLISSDARMQLEVHHPIRVALMQGHEPVTMAHVCLEGRFQGSFLLASEHLINTREIFALTCFCDLCWFQLPSRGRQILVHEPKACIAI